VVADLWLPIVLSTVALFFASFVSWMVLPIHHQDWRKAPGEEGLLTTLAQSGIRPGNYMFPGCERREDMKSEEFQARYAKGPCGVMTVFPKVNMGRNLGLTLVYFLAVSFCLGYLATLALEPGADFFTVFRFVSTAGILTFLSAIVQHSIWFRNRIVGHVIESIAYAAIVAAIFAAMWPAS
jgi:hypothetical protein